MRLMKKTPAVVAWLATQLGDYPFSQTGGLTTSLNPGFALENQTRPTYPALGSSGSGIVVHELAHQWFGDSVAVESWRDIWLNEGSATFMEVRYDETHGGQDAQAWLESVVELLRRRRPVLAPGRLRPGSAQHLRLAGLPARGDDDAGAAPPGG